ncbi:MAG: site-2 protease family protein, partial [Gemmatimonadota bacterium]|nr:site-2 protease family protein [Gemmatimonadota bacterium]
MNFWRKTVSPVVPPPPPTPTSLPVQHANSSRLWVHMLLFLCTIASTAIAGAMQQGVDPLTSIAALVHLVEGLPFAATLLFILTVHEFGHYFAARRWGVRASLPYFLPLPYVSFLGTLGAVIKIR